MIIGIQGLIGSGKDTIGNYLVQQYGFKRIAFADKLKDILSVMFGWDRKLLEGDTTESRNWRNQIDHWWASKLNIPDFTPRVALQKVGTDLIRNHFHSEFWIIQVEKELEQNPNTNFVVCDLRFENEIESLRKQNAKFIRVTRTEPEWAIKIKEGNDPSVILNQYNVHESEYYNWLNPIQDATHIENTDSIESLYETIDEFMKTQKLR